MNYASQVWAQFENKYIKRIHKLQNKALIVVVVEFIDQIPDDIKDTR